jgi:hypothetical protein
MLTKILKKLTLRKEQKESPRKSFLEMPIRDQRKIIKKAVEESNKEQRKLVERYENKFGHA